MSRWKKPLTHKEVIKILQNLGFTQRPQNGTSHIHWVKNDPFRKVTVDPPKSPFDAFLVQSMARQAGVSVKEFYQALNK